VSASSYVYTEELENRVGYACGTLFWAIAATVNATQQPLELLCDIDAHTKTIKFAQKHKDGTLLLTHGMKECDLVESICKLAIEHLDGTHSAGTV